MKLALFVSGGLGLRVLKHLELGRAEILCVYTDKKSEDILTLAERQDIPVFVGNPRNQRACEFLEEFEVDLLLSVNYLFIIRSELFQQARLAVNVHGSMLPKYRGRTPHVWAIINNETSTGITAHVIDQGCDTGDIIRQVQVPIGPKDTGAVVLEKFNELYLPLIDRIIQDFEQGTLRTFAQNHHLATTFGKRTPDDGHINWSWHRERIQNWVRAQAQPYPGAFTFYEGKKVIVDEVTMSELGFKQEDENGKVLRVDPVVVKTPNGALALKTIRNMDALSDLVVGKILD